MRVLTFVLSLLLPVVVFAADDAVSGKAKSIELNPCPLQDMLPEIGCIGGGVDGLAKTIEKLVPPAIDIFLGLMIIMLMVYAISLVIGSTDENAVTEARKAFIFAVIGSFVVFFREAIYNTVGLGGGSGALVSLDRLLPPFQAVLAYMQVAASACAMVFVSVRAIQLFSAGGDEGKVSSQRGLLLNAVVGVGIVTLAGSIVRAALPGGFGILSGEVEGIALYVLYIFGALIGLGIIIGGVMLVVSYDESIQERAKKSIFASIIILVVLICLGAIISLLGA